MKHTVFWNGLLMHCVMYITNCHENRGESFRTAFKGLGGLRALTVAPFMALSASAPSGIERCVKESLELRDCVTVKVPLDWPNINQEKSSVVVSSFFASIANVHNVYSVISVE